MLRAARIALSPQGLRLHSSDQYSVHLRRILVLPLDILQTCPGIAKIYPASLKSDTLPADMLSYHIDTEFWTALKAICMFDKAESSESLSCPPVR